MAETYVVKITTQAQEQLHQITHYIASELKAPDTALHLLDTLEDAISSLSEFPQRIALTEEEPWHNYGIRKMPVKNFLVYFWCSPKKYFSQNPHLKPAFHRCR